MYALRTAYCSFKKSKHQIANTFVMLMMQLVAAKYKMSKTGGTNLIIFQWQEVLANYKTRTSTT